MSSPDHPPIASVVTDADFGFSQIVGWAKRHATPYHLTVAAVLGGVTVVFTAVIALLILVALNFNVLGWTE